jgi:DNA polymerase IV
MSPNSDFHPGARKIIHFDCDCFFAAIEMRDDPSLQGLPVAVGGSEDRRGVIATCNYEARKFGIHSAMASATARRLCRDLIIISPNMEKYRLASRQIHTIFADYTSLIEPLSLDEAYLDVTQVSACKGSATLIAKAIKRRVREEVGITISAGIAPNKFLAKIASDWHKPDGLFVVTPDRVADFVARLPVRKLHGVGKVMTGKLHSLGIETCQDLQRFSVADLLGMFGSFGERLYHLSRGLDDRSIQTQSRRKSISVEHTFSKDLPSLQACLATLPALLQALHRRLQNSHPSQTIAKQFVKIKFHDFTATTVEQVSQTLDPVLFSSLCEAGFMRGNKPVRLLGLGVRLPDNHPSGALGEQLELPLKRLST